MRHQPGHAAVAIEERVNPQQAMVGPRSGNDRLGLADTPVGLLEALQESRDGTGANGDETADLDISFSQFARYNSVTFLGRRIFDPEKICWQQFAKATTNFADSLAAESTMVS
jgi:hypothetical protein